MNPRVVCDASALVALMLDGGPDGQWAAAALSGADLVAPGLVGFEAANIIRRHDLAGLVSADQAAQAHADLLDLAIEHWPYVLLAPRAWQLRQNLSIYDAGYAPSPSSPTRRSSRSTDESVAHLACAAPSPPLTRRIRDRSADVATPPGTRRAQW